MPEYTFKYLRADREEVEMKPFFQSQQEAEVAKKSMQGAGATCTDVYPVVETGPREPDDYLGKKVWSFERYLNMELAILDYPDVDYQIVYKYIGEFSPRIRRFVQENAGRIIEKQEERYPGESEVRGQYPKQVSAILERKSHNYGPLDGSVPEDIGKMLKGLADLVANM